MSNPLLTTEDAGCGSKGKNHRNRQLFKTGQPRGHLQCQVWKKHIGYMANIVETVSNSGFLIIDYQYKQISTPILVFCTFTLNSCSFKSPPLSL